MSNDTIINDLIKKKPKGPKGVKVTYTVDENYDYNVDRYIKTYIPSLPGYGYSDDVLFNLGLHSRTQATHYLRQRDFEGKSDWKLGRMKATLTRRTNNLWRKLEDAVQRVKQEGRKGIYSVHAPYREDTFGHLFAESRAEAKQNAQIFFGYLYPKGTLQASFIKVGRVEDLSDMNKKSIDTLEKSIREARVRIEKQEKEIENFNSRLSTLKMVEKQQIAVETIHALDEKAADAPQDEKEEE